MNAAGQGRDARTALIFGTFDVSNYGDLLFPIVAAHRLAPHGFDVVPVSPTTHATVFGDAVRAEPIGKLPDGLPCDGVLIGGGEIVHAWPATFLDEYRIGDLPAWAYLSLWIGATAVGALRDVPIVWNAPGVPKPFPEAQRQRTVGPALAAADYVAVRDEASRRFLGCANADLVEVAPDTAADLAKVWPLSALDAAFRRLMQRKGADGDVARIAVHPRVPGQDPATTQALARNVDALAGRTGWSPIILAIGPSLGDGRAARALSAALTVDHVCLDDPEGLREIAAAIAFAEAYIGNSLHGYVTALGYRRPGVIVAQPSFRKFAGFASHAGRPDDVVKDWPAGLARIAEARGTAPGMPAEVDAALDRHWERVVSALGDAAAGRSRRASFLRNVLADGLRSEGMGWLLGPVAPRPRQAPGLAGG